MALADARWSDEQYVLVFAYEVSGSQIKDGLSLDGTIEIPVEIFQRLLVAEGSGLPASFDQAIMPDC